MIAYSPWLRIRILSRTNATQIANRDGIEGQSCRRLFVLHCAAAFNQLYNGTESTPGLCEAESLLGSLEQLRELSQRMPLGVVTGRPREEAEAFLTRFGIAEFFSVVITMEDAPAKPSPEPVKAALSKLGVSRAWMLGDTPDDMVAALAAGVLPVGVCAPGTELEGTTNILTQSGAARTLLRWTDILEVLP